MNTLMLSWPIKRSGYPSIAIHAIANPASDGPQESAVASICRRSPRLAITWSLMPERLARWTLLPGGE